MAYAAGLGPVGGNTVGVQIPPPALELIPLRSAYSDFMSLLVATQLTALATALLAVGAIFTAVFAVLAFRKQSREVSAIERQVSDQQELTRQQAELLRVQSGQLELQRQQFADQREANIRQAEVFDLQATELRESILERALEEEQRRSAQASRVFIREDRHAGGAAQASIDATVLNASDRPIYGTELRWRHGSAKRDDAGPELLGTTIPGAEYRSSREFLSDADMEASSVLLTFRDAAGAAWICRPDGTLTDELAEQRASASLPRKAAGLLKREIQGVVKDYLARSPATTAQGPAAPDPTRHEQAGGCRGATGSVRGHDSVV
jgi:hypothetical protein